MTEIIQLVTALAGSFGFALLLNVRGIKLIPASVGGLFAWGVYLFVFALTGSEHMSCFIAAMGLALYAELMSIAMKAPATLFLVSAAIPLIPGSLLYATARCLVMGDYAGFLSNGQNTLITAAAISIGMLVMISLFSLVRKTVEKFKLLVAYRRRR